MLDTTVRANFKKRAVVLPESYHWEASPTPGVHRVKLDRIGLEVARATSLVRYELNQQFPFHHHEGGEEIVVLKGTFIDDDGIYPAGTYLRNPPGTSHRPSAGPEGALLFVKLAQFQEGDAKACRIHTQESNWLPGLVSGLKVLPLHQYESEHVALVRWAPNTQFNPHVHFGGEEILVIEGTFHDEHGTYPSGSWYRSRHQSTHTPFTGSDGALIYVKTGHLPSQHTTGRLEG
ncbi:MAG: cupin domain-containing protein [Litoricolaceae bacterium]|nr:cupin domain-containing protein [Litorivicinaceae bacterium]